MASPTFERDYIETGKVKLVFSEFPLQGHINAVPAAEAARCAGVQNQNAFWQMHDILFNNQSLWGADQNPQTRFEGYATQLKLDSAAFKACMSNGEQSAAVAKARDAGIQMNVQGTPAFAVNGKLVDTTAAQSVDDIVAAMRQQVDAALAGK